MDRTFIIVYRKDDGNPARAQIVLDIPPSDTVEETRDALASARYAAGEILEIDTYAILSVMEEDVEWRDAEGRRLYCKASHRNVPCNAPIQLHQFRRKRGYCDDCEIEHLLTEGWFDAFLSQLEAWKINSSHMLEDGRGDN